MKKAALLLVSGLLLVISFQLSSCKKEEKKEEENPLVGTWIEKSANAKYYENGVLIFDTTIIIPELDAILTFNSDYTFTTKVKNQSDVNGVYKVDGDQITATPNVGGDVQVGKFKISGNDLTFHKSTTETYGGITYKDDLIEIYRRK